ncbi:hypothetical protein Rsub_00371 [Raphidocelis subcapitata]|uniref:Uncharacterized protein n=1 Tax=Raphidocelis subcapitata TaxID=307507 RepID=A0A2V0NQ64_9CHLO|nr:hypothetical protein Rsub_00371 [Raphidocelis subcapitata]|eukprot:GBF87660.1 hypothetical protein Rsub_00371 [Raphidocelis subcapitata]
MRAGAALRGAIRLRRCATGAAPWLTAAVANGTSAAFQHEGGSQGAGRADGGWARRVAACVAAAGAAALAGTRVAHGEALDDDMPHSPEQLRAEFADWIRRQGGHMEGARLGSSGQGPSAGTGLFSTPALRAAMRHPWLGRRLGALLTGQRAVPVADVPLGLALTADAAVRDPDLGASYRELLDLGLIDGRTAVIAMLTVERAREAGSRYAPWLRLLPESFSTPLWFDSEQMRELRGTTLEAAAAAQERVLRAQWQRLRPALVDMLRRVGSAGEPTFEDFLWAHSVFWSRGQSLPVPVRGAPAGGGSGGGADGLEQLEGEEEPAAGSSSSSSSSNGANAKRQQAAGGTLRVEVWEGVVPGLDFANHSVQPNCWWEVAEGSEPAADGDARRVLLVTNRATLPKRPGGELTISYGDKSNEELLMLYGFASADNPHEQLMIPCPLPPPDEWTDDTRARLELLRARGAAPQIFLPAARLPTLDSGARGWRRGGGGGVADDAGSALPSEARAVLEAFIMPPEQVAARLDALGRGGDEAAAAAAVSGAAAAGEAEGVTQRVERLGNEMALITTLVRLLELRVLALEGDEEGTGPLEADEARLAADGPLLAPWLRACLLYRMGQKALARAYLAAARHELQDTMRALRAAVDVEEAEAARAAARGGQGQGGSGSGGDAV